MSTISKRKHKRSDIVAYYRNESKTFWFVPFKIWTEADHFDMAQIFFLSRSDRFRFGPKILGQSKTICSGPEIVWGKVERFYLTQTVRDRSKTFWCGAKKFFSRADRFCFVPKIWGQSRTIWFGPKIVSGKAERYELIQKHIDRSKTFWIGTKNSLA